MNQTRKDKGPDPYHGVGGRYVINEKGERMPAPEETPAKPAARKRKEKPS